MQFKSVIPYIPIIIYFIFSATLSYNIQTEIKSIEIDDITKVSKTNFSIRFLLISSLIVLLHLFIHQIPSIISIIFSLVPCFIYAFFSGLFSYSNEQLIEGNQFRSRERNFSIDARKEWSEYLDESLMSQNSNKDIIFEIDRIKNILQYSSFFRTEKSSDLLDKLRNANDNIEILVILKKVR
tara:strand:- start:372 stop:917 length:546 start_codon:yes stop_codon:yes gene_type:complete